MKNATQVVGVSLLEKLRQLLRANHPLLKALAWGFCGFVASGSTIVGGLAPFGVAVCGAARGRWILPATVGAVLGYLVAGGADGSVKYLAAILLAAGVKWLLSNRPKWNQAALSALVSAGAMVAPSLVIAFYGGINAYGVILAICEGMISGSGAYFFSRAVHVLERRSPLVSANATDLSSLIVVLAIGVISLVPWTFQGISLGKVLASLLVMALSYSFGVVGGAVSGTVADLALRLAVGGYSFGGYSIPGLACGLMGPFGKTAVGCTYVISSTLWQLVASTQDFTYEGVLEWTLAGVAFLLLPTRWIQRLVVRGEAGAAEGLEQLVQQRLSMASASLQDIAQTTRQVSEKLGQMRAGAQEDVFLQASQQCCKNCKYNGRCWQLSYGDTIQALEKLTPRLRQEGAITPKDLPVQLKGRCDRQQELCDCINEAYQAFSTRQGLSRKVAQVRGVVSDQFEGMAQLLAGLQEQMQEITFLSPRLQQKLQAYFAQCKLEPQQVLCYEDRFGRMTVEVRLPNFKGARLDGDRSALEIGEICERDFDRPTITEWSGQTVAVYSERAAFALQVGVAQQAAGQSRLCGDSFQKLEDHRGHTHLILSDGMGSGGGAAVDSAMTTGLLSRLIEAGVGFDAALRLVNSALLVKSGEESLSTVDLASVDLFTGRVSFYKAGAAPTFLVRDGKCGYVESASLPVGILNDVGFEKSGITLREGDLLVMVSDGVTDLGVEWVLPELEQKQGKAPQAICQHLLDRALERRSQGHADDITVVAARLVSSDGEE